MKTLSRRLRNENGAVLFITVVVLIAASLVGMAMITNSFMDKSIAINYKHKLQTYYASDGLMTYLAQEVINQNSDRYVGSDDTIVSGDCKASWTVNLEDPKTEMYYIKTVGFKQVGLQTYSFQTPLEQRVQRQQEGGWQELTGGTVDIPVTFFDFHTKPEPGKTCSDEPWNCPEFNPGWGHPCDLAGQPGGLRLGMVQNRLDSDGLPVRGSNVYFSYFIEKWFRQWEPEDFRRPFYQAGEYGGNLISINNHWHDTSFKNVVIEDTLVFRDDDSDGTYEYDNQLFFPIDGRGFGNEGAYKANSECPGMMWGRNCSFAMMMKMNFRYKPGQVFDFRGDDDVWVFVDSTLALDLGGIHCKENGTIDMDVLAGVLGLNEETMYSFDFFYCERQSHKSSIRILTNISFFIPHLPGRRHYKRDYGRLDDYDVDVELQTVFDGEVSAAGGATNVHVGTAKFAATGAGSIPELQKVIVRCVDLPPGEISEMSNLSNVRAFYATDNTPSISDAAYGSPTGFNSNETGEAVFEQNLPIDQAHYIHFFVDVGEGIEDNGVLQCRVSFAASSKGAGDPTTTPSGTLFSNAKKLDLVGATDGDLTAEAGQTCVYLGSARFGVSGPGTGTPLLTSLTVFALDNPQVSEASYLTSVRAYYDESGTPSCGGDPQYGTATSFDSNTDGKATIAGALAIDNEMYLHVYCDAGTGIENGGQVRLNFSFGSDSKGTGDPTSNSIGVIFSNNEAPTDITLVPMDVNENEPVHTTVGALSTTDPDAGDTHTYTLVAGAGDEDNFRFAIDGGFLRTADILNHESKPACNIRILTADDGAPEKTFEKALVVTVNDVNDAPVVTDQGFSAVEGMAYGTPIGIVSAGDEDAVHTLTYSILTQTPSGAFSINPVNGVLTVDNNTLLDADLYPTIVLTVQVRDDGGLTDDATVTVSVSPQAGPGPGAGGYPDWGEAEWVSIVTDGDGAYITGSPVANFPVLIRFDPSVPIDFTKVKDDGTDLRFSLVDGTHLDYEIERWVNTGGNDTGEVWVLLPSIKVNTKEGIWVYYDNASASDESNSEAVFSTSNGFEGVWHLGESSGSAMDATANTNNGTFQGDVPDPRGGGIGLGQDFDGIDDRIEVSGHSSINMGDDFTISCWVKPGSTSGWKAIMEHGRWDWTNSYGLFKSTNGNIFHFRWSADAVGGDSRQDFGSYTAGQWTHVAGTFTGGTASMYVDGGTPTTNGGESAGLTYNTDLNIGCNGTDGENWIGMIDEVRVESNRSSNWITLCYQNQRKEPEQCLVQWGFSAPGNLAPVAVASADPTSGEASLYVTFSSVGSYDDTLIVSYDWDFGDGSAHSSQSGPTHTYTDAGTYIVTLTVFDNQSAVGADFVTIEVGDAVTYPGDVSDGLVLWLDANDAGTIAKDASNNVTLWEDKSSSRWDCTVPAEFYSPEYQATAVNGKPGIFFGAGADGLRSPNTNLTTDMTLFVVAADAVPAKNWGCAVASCQPGDAESANSFQIGRDPYVPNTGWNWQYTFDGVPGAMRFTDAGSGATTDPVLLEAKFDNGAASRWLNGDFVATDNFTDTDLDIRSIGLGIQRGGATVWSGHIAEVILYNVPLGTADMNSVRSYLCDKYSLTCGTGGETVCFNSYDAAIQTTGLPHATCASGGKTANIIFYESFNNDGVNKGTLLTPYNSGTHSGGFNNLEKYWGATNGYPYAGKSTVDRGGDADEGNTPSPTGVRDLQLHPPSTSQLTVAAFAVPEDGDYTVKNLGARRPSTSGGYAELKMFNSSKTLMATVLTQNDRAWDTDVTVYDLGFMSANDTIFFAVDNYDGYSNDATEIAWTVCLSGGGGEPPPPENVAPTASFTVNPSTGTAPLDVNFDATASLDSDGSIVSWSWNFGDAGTGSGQTTSHEFTTENTFTITLTVTDDDGATGITTRTVTVEAGGCTQVGCESNPRIFPGGTNQVAQTITIEAGGEYWIQIQVKPYARNLQLDHADGIALNSSPSVHYTYESTNVNPSGWYHVHTISAEATYPLMVKFTTSGGSRRIYVKTW